VAVVTIFFLRPKLMPGDLVLACTDPDSWHVLDAGTGGDRSASSGGFGTYANIPSLARARDKVRDQASDPSERLEAVLEAYALISHEQPRHRTRGTPASR
jgi:hypothetical protein